ncbi:ROK family transcriptional regulator [Williamsia sp. CHRR-6]|uniref:ROK family transcriptional regulator n=1 Tax=Williamsia sp. CHRR-6 TaxID=2835871 RepID=UPI001BD9AAD1|nr:ROK family transcriptional regulator [Williamsia sp. CHRR-6]MBT0567531.1 ROK family transcriptional regulator [Williamsia sp. CHRR-6]
MTTSINHLNTRTRRPAAVRPRPTGARPRLGVRPLAMGSAVGPLTRTPIIHIATPQLHLSTKPSAVVLRIARLQGPIFRDDAAAQSGLSISTVNRQVSALLKAGLLRERADLAPAGAIGRPRLPFELNSSEFLTLGLHIGLKVTSITTHDLFHRVVGAIQIPTPVADTPEQTLAAIGVSARRFASRWPNQRILWTGVAIGGRVNDGGLVDHPRLGWTQAPVGPVLAQALGIPVSVASHVEAMAAAELLVNPDDDTGSFMYFYAREMVGVAFTVEGSVYSPTAGPPVIGHFPAGPTTLLDPTTTGQLEPAVSDTGIVAAARAAGLTVETVDDVHAAAAADDPTATAILLERAEVLGRAVSLIADVFNPDHVILGGQAFTDSPSTLPAVARAVRATPAALHRDVRVTRAGATVQQQAAGAVSLDAIYSDPLEALALTA